MRRLASWLPPVVWMAVILWLSGGSWSSAETDLLLEPLLRGLLPWATPAQIASLHVLIRKVAHLMEYAILAMLWLRALVREGQRPARAAWMALGVSVAWAAIDEIHQSFVPSRTSSPVDVGIDAAGAAAAVGIARGDWRRVVDQATMALWWITAVGGAVALVVNTLAGVHTIALWFTTPAAALALVFRWRSQRARARTREV